jgi:hypothetical protein
MMTLDELRKHLMQHRYYSVQWWGLYHVQPSAYVRRVITQYMGYNPMPAFGCLDKVRGEVWVSDDGQNWQQLQ